MSPPPAAASGRSAVERFARAYADIARRARFELAIELGNQARYTVSVLGVLRRDGMLVVGAPRNAEQALVAVSKGQALICRWFNASAAFRFRAVIANLAFEPVPLLYLNQLHAIKCRHLRDLPRALAALNAALRTPQPHSALVVDLSVGGAQIGVGEELGLALGARVELAIRPHMMERDFVLTLPCQVTAVLGAQDREHPQIHFYGLSFEALGEHEQLVLHAYVQERLAAETDLLSQTLLLEAEEVSGLD